MERKKTFNVAMVGATGVVGREVLQGLNKFIPIKEFTPYASERSRGKSVEFNGKQNKVKVLEAQSVSKFDIAIFSAGGSTSKEFAPLFAEKGAFVIDNSSAWRMDPNCPLIIPEVNPHAANKDQKIIANPNCSTIQMVVALKPLHDAAKIKSIQVATYQSVSGAGQKGIEDLEDQTKAWAKGEKIPAPKKISHQIAMNLVPHIDVFVEEGYTKEEMKMVHETRKILEAPEIQISATCVRVPVFRAHSEAIWIETEKPLSPEKARSLLQSAPGVKVIDDPKSNAYPMPRDAAHRGETFVGRIRKDLSRPNGLALWVVSDNLLKGGGFECPPNRGTSHKEGAGLNLFRLFHVEQWRVRQNIRSTWNISRYNFRGCTKNTLNFRRVY